MTRVGILETGKPSSPKHGDFADMFRTYFAKQTSLEFSVFSICEGASVPSATAQDAWLITGSPAGVYEDLPWLPPLRELIRDVSKQSIPMLGICFGHQIMAQALGGTVIKSDKGRGIGVQQYHLSAPGQWLGGSSPSLSLIASHQDQVVEAPPNAVLLASSSFCSYASLAYGKAGLSFQPHPEFTVDGARAIVKSWQAISPTDPKIVSAAEASFDSIIPDAPRLAATLGSFLEHGLAA